MKAFCLAPAHDTPNRKDASGAFQPEARAFVKASGLRATVTLFDSNRALADRRLESSRALARQTDVDVFAFFCHGWRDGLQCGWQIRKAGELADLLALAGRRTSTIILYACDAARDADADREDDKNPGPGGDGGMAAAIVTGLRARGWEGRLYAHATPGHTTRNPWVRFWGRMGPDAPWERGAWLVEPRTPLWPAWRAALAGDLRLKFPFLTRAEISAVLAQ